MKCPDVCYTSLLDFVHHELMLSFNSGMPARHASPESRITTPVTTLSHLTRNRITTVLLTTNLPATSKGRLVWLMGVVQRYIHEWFAMVSSCKWIGMFTSAILIPVRLIGCNQRIFGTRYKCAHPSCPDFDLCEKCEAHPKRSHPIEHPFIKMRVRSDHYGMKRHPSMY
jgi:hypothetical protein